MGDIYAKRTILKFLPEETKDEEKVKAGKTEKKKEILVEASGKSAAAAAAPQNTSNETVEKVKEFYLDIEKPQESENNNNSSTGGWQEPDDNETFLEKKLARAEDEIRDLNTRLEDRNSKITQLQEVVKKSSFTTAADSADAVHFKGITVPMLLIEARKLVGQGWHKLNVTLERHS